MRKIYIDGDNLSIQNIFDVAVNGAEVTYSEETSKKVSNCRDFVEEVLKEDSAVYGINTGFGILSDVKISNDNLEELQVNLLRSHAIGIGKPLPKDVVRATMLLRANVMAKGFSGVTVETMDKLVELINRDVVPFIPDKGTVGASGDLAPLAHMALVLIGEGLVIDESGKIAPAAEELAKKSIDPIRIKAKEGLALINGTQVMTAIGALTLHRVKNLVKLADIALSTSLEAVMGTDRAFDPKVHKVRPHIGQAEVAENVLRMLEESGIRDSHKNCAKVQDAYSFRCGPQVHGAARDAVRHVEQVIITEMNSSTDNPLIFPDERETISGGNFHGEPVALVMDYLTIAVAELGSISERRVEQLINPVFSQAPAFLVKNKGLNSGFMIAHVAAASLASENKTKAFPASVDSIPTSAGKEDHVSMGTISARKTAEVTEDVANIIAIEILTAVQALEFRKPLKAGKGVDTVYTTVRSEVPFMENDYFLHPQFEKVKHMEFSIVNNVEKTIGELK